MTDTTEVDLSDLCLTPAFEAHMRSLYAPGESIVGALDMARYRDTAAVCFIGRPRVTCTACAGEGVGESVSLVDDACPLCTGTVPGLKVPRALVWRSGGHDRPIRYGWVEAAILAAHRLYDLRAFGKDPKYGDQIGENMSDAGVVIEDFPQSPERMGRADTELRGDILRGEFAHDGDPILTAHIHAGKAKDVGQSLFMVVQQSGAQPPPIDACKALSMANALEKLEVITEPLGAWG